MSKTHLFVQENLSRLVLKSKRLDELSDKDITAVHALLVELEDYLDKPEDKTV